jgi:hypothetical protein
LESAAAIIQASFRAREARTLVVDMRRERAERGPPPAKVLAERDRLWKQQREAICKPGYPHSVVQIKQNTSPQALRRSEEHPAARVAQMEPLAILRSGVHPREPYRPLGPWPAPSAQPP